MNGIKKEDDGLDLPDFLRRKPGDTKSTTHERHKAPPPIDSITQRQNELRALHEEQRKAKRYKALNKLKAERGTWDPKKREWVKE